jgi:predicted nucleotide-binding protein (sugar kinase/HSP70/actin superfamily)
MELRSEKSIKEYLKKLPDDTIIRYYLDVEFTPFPVLIIEEYTRRFKRKTKDEIIKSLKYQANLARKKTRELAKMAKTNKLIGDITHKKSDEVIRQAKKKGYEISEKIAKKGGRLGSQLKSGTKSGVKKGITAGKKLKATPQDHLELLEKLGKLKKAGIITDREFQSKKKQILAKI